MLWRALISRSIHGCFALGLLASLAIPACADHRPVGPLRDGDVACQNIVAHCADPVASLGEPYQSCYQKGVDGNGEECLNVYDDCLKSCEEARAMLGGSGGEGGKGEAGAPNNEAGAPGNEGGAGGHAGTPSTGEAGAATAGTEGG
jgi:hypothetical protein